MTFLILNYFFDKNLFNVNNILFVWFCNFLVLNSVAAFYVKNPVFSLIFLIINYLTSAVLMLLFGLQFLVFVFLLVYVGAVSILLLFTLMLLNLKIIFYKNINFKYFFLFFLFLISFEFLFIYYNDVKLFVQYTELESIDWFSLLFFENEISSFGTEIFINNKDLVFLSSIFLFLILVASINIVLTVKYSKKQVLNLQLKNIKKILKK